LVTPKVAAYGEIPIFAIVPPLALTMALLSGIIFGSEPGFAKRIYGWVGGAGLIYAGYAVFAGVTDPGMLLWRQKTAYVDSITGTFVNHNTAATFFGCVAVIWYVRFLRDLSRRVNFNRGRDLGYIVTKVVNLPRQEMVSLLAVLFLLGTTFMTRSRAGSLLTIGVLGCITMLYVYREIRAARGLLVLSVLTLAVGVVAVNTVGDRFIHEIEIRGTTDTARVEGWLSTLAIIRDHPWFGVGLGTFETVFPAYRVPAGGVWGVWDHAHSTPLELMAEMGIPFGLLILTLWVIMLAVLVQASAKGAQGRSLATAGVGIGLLGTLHSLVDFSLQIPGFSIVCCALMGASLAGTLASKVSKKVPLPLTANDDIAGFAPGIRAAHE
jgi:O-antigen ligase